MPHALVWGIPYDIFFTLDPHTIKPFEKAYQIKTKDEAQVMNYNAWLIGKYICSSIASCLSRKAKYPSEPFKSRDDDEEGYVLSDADRFEMFASVFNTQHKELATKKT